MKFIATILFLACLSFAAGADSLSTPVAAEQVPVDVMQEELAMRDSVMQVRDSLCSIEKDSLRSALVVQEAKCANWEQSYQTMKRDNEVCAQALGTTLEINEKNKEKADDERRRAAMAGGMSFTSGLLVGALLFWLIFD